MGKKLRLEDRGNQAPQPGTEVKIAVDLSRSKWVYCVRWEGAERLRLSTGSELSALIVSALCIFFRSSPWGPVFGIDG